MAMNKKEQAEFDAMKRAVVVAGALNWTQDCPRDVPVPITGQVRGFDFRPHSKRIVHALSGPVTHATGEDIPSKTTTQRGIPMYSTKLLALKGLRRSVELQAANDLADIDELIAAEMKASA